MSVATLVLVCRFLYTFAYFSEGAFKAPGRLRFLFFFSRSADGLFRATTSEVKTAKVDHALNVTIPLALGPPFLDECLNGSLHRRQFWVSPRYVFLGSYGSGPQKPIASVALIELRRLGLQDQIELLE